MTGNLEEAEQFGDRALEAYKRIRDEEGLNSLAAMHSLAVIKARGKARRGRAVGRI